MKLGKRDRWADRGEVLDDPLEELDRLAHRLHDARARLAMTEETMLTPEEAEKQLDALATELFAGTLAPDEHDRRKAEITRDLTEKRRVRDEAARVVAVGQEACERQVARLCDRELEVCAEQKIRLDAELAKLMERVNALEVGLRLVEERRDAVSLSGDRRTALRAKFSKSAQREIERKELEAARALRDRPETPEERRQRHELEAAQVLGVQRPSGQPAYVRLPSGGGHVRLR